MKEELRFFEAFFEVRGKSPTKIIGKIPYNSESVDIGYTEFILPGAFARSIKNGADIKSFWNHDTSKVLGSTKAGTLKLTDGPDSLRIELTPPNNTWGKDALESVSRGDTSGFSFGFSVESDYWQDNKRYLEDVNLFEVSPTPMPAYGSSTAYARSAVNQKSKKQKLSEFFDKRREEKKMKRAASLKRAEAYFARKNWENNGEFLREVMKRGIGGSADTEDPRLNTRASGLSTDGYETPENLVADLVMGDHGSEILKRCTIYKLGENSNLRLPLVDEKTRVNAQYGGARSYWTEESEEITNSRPGFRLVNLVPKKLASLSYITGELMEDGAGSYLENTLAVSAARAIDTAIISGNGAGEPLGIANSGALVVVDKVGGQAAGSFLAENAAAMAGRFYAEGHMNRYACWLINPELYATLLLSEFSAADTGAGLIQWKSGAGRFNKMLGIDIIPSPGCSNAGQVADILLCDLSAYAVAFKAVKQSISGHVRFEFDEMCFKLTQRLDGSPTWASPVTGENSGVTESPFVGLALRS